MMCIEKVISLLKKKSTLPPSSEPESMPKPTSGPLSIPHPEEAPDYSKTMENADLDAVLDDWEKNYHVAETYQEYWKTRISIRLDDNLPYPAATYTRDGIRHLAIRPEWVNPGVIAHEQAHNSYALMTEEQKEAFSTIYTPLKSTDPLIVLVYSQNRYGLTNDIEGHAELYRYLGNEMPEVLKKYYPKLFV